MALGHGHGDLGLIGRVGVADVAGDSEPPVRVLVLEGQPGEVVDEVDVEQVVDDAGARLARGEEPAPPPVGRLLFEGGRVARAIGRKQRAEHDFRPVGERGGNGANVLRQPGAGEVADAVVHTRKAEQEVEIVRIADEGDTGPAGRHRGGAGLLAKERELTADGSGAGHGERLRPGRRRPADG